jgi:hypothetical protein
MAHIHHGSHIIIMSKKTNYVSYELERLNTYAAQLLEYLDDNPPNLMVDRIEIMQSQRGNPIIKVIASKETQLKCWSDRLKELPLLVEQLNKLRALVEEDNESKNIQKRGGGDIPGIFSRRLLKGTEDNGEEEKTNSDIVPEGNNPNQDEDDEDAWEDWED